MGKAGSSFWSQAPLDAMVELPAGEMEKAEVEEAEKPVPLGLAFPTQVLAKGSRE